MKVKYIKFLFSLWMIRVDVDLHWVGKFIHLGFISVVFFFQILNESALQEKVNRKHAK